VRLLGPVVAGLLVGAAVTVGGYGAASVHEVSVGPVRGPGTADVVITVRNSRFSPDRLRVWEGTQVVFEVRNTDPIGHELVVGPEALHERHRGGSEASHPPVPGEVSLGPGQTGATVYEAEEPGTVEIVCHLPGHESYGMVGTVEVVPRPAASG
jgi:uncharacterized cupredoxin-like copper-binding protein